MFGGKTILVVVPARGGSKGIPRKNLRKVGGISLVSRVGQVVSNVPFIDRAVVSTDDEEIALEGERSGLSSPFLRPKALSGDLVGDAEVLTHALLECERIDQVRYDIIVMLQPTSPLREAKHVTDTINVCVSGNWDAVWTVSETDSKAHPMKQLIIGDGANLDYYDRRGESVIARQQLSTLYHRNGIAYAITRDCLLEKKTIKGDRTTGLLIPGNHISIDTEWDLELANWVFEKRYGSNS